MEDEEMPPSQASSLMRGRNEEDKEDEDKPIKKEVNEVWSVGSQTEPVSNPSLRPQMIVPLSRKQGVFPLYPPGFHPARPSHSPLVQLLHLLNTILPHPTMSGSRKRGNISLDRGIYVWSIAQNLRSCLTMKKSFLGPLFNITSIDGKSVEDTCNFLQTPVVIKFVRGTEMFFKVWVNIYEARDTFPDVRVFVMYRPI